MARTKRFPTQEAKLGGPSCFTYWPSGDSVTCGQLTCESKQGESSRGSLCLTAHGGLSGQNGGFDLLETVSEVGCIF